jgi:uncharacterized membrane protein YkvA (DUF1232 family)
VRQLAEGRRVERDPDRGAPAPAEPGRSLTLWAWLAVAVGAAVALWLLLVGFLFALGRREDARELAAFLPDCVVLVRRLLGDPRVPRRAKVALVGLLAYLVFPLDVVPDFLPVVGLLDDAIAVAAVLAFVGRSAGTELIEELWPGSERGARVVLALTSGRRA